ncbi:MAG: chemotaxis protein CheW [Rickettsiales bacterium]
MSKALTVINATSGQGGAIAAAATQEFVTMRIGKQLFGISVLAVQDVLRRQTIAPVPLSPSVVAGSLNLRGRIVTAIDMRARLELGPYPQPDTIMMAVVEYQHELFALMIDQVGDVLQLAMNRFEKVPSNMDATWRGMAAGVFKLEGELLVILDVASVIDHIQGIAA